MAFSFIFLYRLLKVYRQITWYVTVRLLLCYDAFLGMLQCKCYCVAIQLILSSEKVAFRLIINKSALDKNMFGGSG